MTTPKLLTMEWIDAVKLKDVETVKEQFDAGAVLKALFNAYGDMVFKYAFVHCDPHAANILVRKRKTEPSGGSKMPSLFRKKENDFQIVFLDFGLAVPETEQFRVQYALFFKSLFTHDMQSMQSVMKAWGIADTEVFASIQLQKPYSAIRSGNYGEVDREEVRAMQRRAHARVRTLLADDAKIPKEITLVGRGIDILRGINRSYGSPINRINMFVESAVQGLGPLHDAETVQLYLDHLRSWKEREGGPDRADTYESVYDQQAVLLREEQIAAAAELRARKTTADLLVTRLMTLYRACVFQWTLCMLDAVHRLSKLYGAIVCCIAPSSAAARANLLEDRLDQMQDTMRVQ
ncbi:aarF domain-containing kinase [Strigomonas culicis]|nr:aarF domain-containing kinase [Strigomonas culicis]|eukprot:EPY20036.1 aarF domain-containing kinase [Strigomonas culicis]